MISLTVQRQIEQEWRRRAEHMESVVLAEWISNCKTEFAKYGFVECPLTDDELYMLSAIDGMDVDTVFDIGSDVACGYTLDQIIDQYL